MKLNLITIAFLLMTMTPRGVFAETTDINQCLRDIQYNWFSKSELRLEGETRTHTSCQVQMTLKNSGLVVVANGAPLSILFEFRNSDGNINRSLESCHVDKEKIHLVFEEKKEDDFEKRERIQMTLLKRHGNGMSLILSKRENKILRPLQQSNLICHLN